MVKKLVSNHELLVYFILAAVFSWSVGIPLVLSASGIIKPLPLWLHYLTAYGPMLAAFVVAGMTQGSKGLNNLFSRIIKLDIGIGWIILAFLPAILFLVLEVISFLTTGKVIDFNLLGQINFLPNLGFFALILWIFNSGIGEEVGWRGFALPRLQKSRSALSASILLSIPWVIWHLPAFFYLPNYIQMGLNILPMFILGIMAASIVYTWFYNSTKGSILIAILFHGAFNFVTASKAGEGLPAAILSTLVIVWAIAVVILYKPQNLALVGKQIT